MPRLASRFESPWGDVWALGGRREGRWRRKVKMRMKM